MARRRNNSVSAAERPPKTKIGVDDFIKIMPYLDDDLIARVILSNNDFQTAIEPFVQTDEDEGYPTDPVTFTTDVLGYQMWDKLAQVCRSVERNHNTVVSSGFSVGKSVIMASIICWWMSTYDDAKVVIFGPTWNQVQNIIFRYIRTVGRKANLPGNILDSPRWEVSSEHFAIGMSPKRSSAEDIASMSGFHSPHMLVVLDEAAGLPRIIWDAAAGFATSDGSRVAAIGNPIEQAGPFWEACNSPNWHYIAISDFEHPNVTMGEEIIPGAVTRRWIEERAEEWASEVPAGTVGAIELPWLGKWYLPQPIFYSKVMGIAPEQAEDQLIRLSWVTEAQQLILEQKNAEIVAGLDPARKGGDNSTLLIRYGNQVVRIRRWNGLDVTQLVDAVGLELREAGVSKCYVDEIGLGCFDDRTDILTENGWKRFSELGASERVLTMNPDTMIAEYALPTRLWRYHYNGKMHGVHNQTTDFLVTPNHNMFLRGENGKCWYQSRIDSLPVRYPRMKRDFNWLGNDTAYYYVPSINVKRCGIKRGTNIAATGNHELKDVVKPEIAIAMDTWLKFLGLFLSEGFTHHLRSEYAVCITQKNIAKEAIIRDVLTELGFKFSEKLHKSGERVFTIHSKQLYLDVKRYGSRAPHKDIPRYVQNLSPRQIRLFLDYYLLGDGYEHKGELHYCTSSIAMANSLQELVLKTGNYASLNTRMTAGSQAEIDGRIITRSSDSYVVSEWIRPFETAFMTSDIKTEDYDGIVYCVTVEPYHLIYTRRMGKCIWTGNSGVLDYGRRVGLPMIGVNFARAALQRKRFANLRAECWWRVRELLREGKLQLLEDNLLAGDLVAPKYFPDLYQRIQLEAKDEIRERIKRSPDTGDALALSYASPVADVDAALASELQQLGGAHKEGPNNLIVARWNVNQVAPSVRRLGHKWRH